ncbi:MAG: hypothetical protein L6Q37_13495 [Bdellovibrionaceae bacterium]|nr:hypothetical protein [Pseudobdellovibrionaceae bacterium]NUM58288.1 hypothetical protein [Pseudobdellovibrionaceae bacterium]
MEIIWIMGFFFIFVTFIFFVIAFFFPEWLGITGSKAKEVMRSHQEENTKESKSIDKIN